ncbi:MAG: hypothetical protein QOJ09_2519 [Actinomycetota bacterium]|nr:hypothetical protein [Actinomycetota bacterium]
MLAFLDTAYFDDVLTAKPEYENAIQLVAVDGSALVGLLDVAVEGEAATIETIAVDPSRYRSGVGSALLDEAKTRLPATVRSLDAWTRDDDQANGWYAAKGFVETLRYLHVYASSPEEAASAIRSPMHDLTLVKGFFHAPIEAESQLRESFHRVHICRRYELALGSEARSA